MENILLFGVMDKMKLTLQEQSSAIFDVEARSMSVQFHTVCLL